MLAVEEFRADEVEFLGASFLPDRLRFRSYRGTSTPVISLICVGSILLYILATGCSSVNIFSPAANIPLDLVYQAAGGG